MFRPISQKSRNVSRAILCLISITLASCITVNVNFPEGAVQKAADDYVRDLYRTKQKKDAEETAKPATSYIDFQPFSWVNEAIAADSINVATPKAKEIQTKLASRLDEVISNKRSGVLGESHDGLLVIKDEAKLKPIQKKKLESLVNAENSDRRELYKEVINTNALPEARTLDIQKSFSRSFQSESPSGTWVESAPGSWAKKP